MATYYSSSNNQRDVAPMIYLPGSFSETPVIPGNMMMYMNTGSYPDTLGGNSPQQNNCIEFQSVEAPVSTPQNREILSSIVGQRVTEHDVNVWRDGRNEFMVMPSNFVQGGQNLQGQGLSLSLGTQIPSAIQIPSIACRNPDSGFGLLLSPNMSVPGDGGGRGRNGSSRDDPARNIQYLPHSFIGSNHDSDKGDMSPYGMNTMARSIPSSRYLKAAQQLLDEVVNVRKALKQPGKDKNKSTSEQGTDGGKEDDGRSKNGPLNAEESSSDMRIELSPSERQELQNKLTKLFAMSDEVDRRYKQYYHQMQIVVSSFDVIAGNGSAKPYTALALQTISRHFCCLRDAITGHIKATCRSLGEQETSEKSKGIGISRLRYVDQQLRQQRALQQLGMMQPHAWRPQRGLPESSVSILRAWLFEHFLHPYPKDSDKIMLARQTGLTRSQVSNWFINARVRLWKPMVEDMYKEETGDRDIDSNSSSENAAKAMKGDNTKCSEYEGEEMQLSASSNAAAAEQCSTASLIDSKSTHFPDTELAGSTTRNSFQSGLPGEPLAGYGLLYQMSEMRRMGSGNCVSLTLGLQHCDGSGFPMSDTTHHSSVGSLRGDPENVYNAAAANLEGHEPAEFELIKNGNTQHRFSSSHLLHDFVA